MNIPKSRTIIISFDVYKDMIDYKFKRENFKPVKRFVEDAIKYYMKNKKD